MRGHNSTTAFGVLLNSDFEMLCERPPAAFGGFRLVRGRASEEAVNELGTRGQTLWRNVTDPTTYLGV